MPQAWTDDRLDERFARVAERFDGVDRRLDGIDRRLEVIDSRLDATQRTIAQGFVAVGASTLTGFVALFTLIATRL